MDTYREQTCTLPQPGGGHAPPAIEQAVTVRTLRLIAGRSGHSILAVPGIVSSVRATITGRRHQRRVSGPLTLRKCPAYGCE